MFSALAQAELTKTVRLGALLPSDRMFLPVGEARYKGSEGGGTHCLSHSAKIGIYNTNICS